MNKVEEIEILGEAEQRKALENDKVDENKASEETHGFGLERQKKKKKKGNGYCSFW